MSVILNILKDIPLPKMVRIRQKFDDSYLENLTEKLQEELQKPGCLEKIKPGQDVAVCVGAGV